MDVVKEEVVSAAEAKAIMNERAKDKNLKYEQKICIEYLDRIPRLTKAKADKMKEELSQISALKPVHVAMIINIMPDNMDEIFMLFGKESFKKEETDKIIEIVKKYKTKKTSV